VKLDKFVEKELKKYDLPEVWMREVQLIAAGKSSEDSAAERGVTKDAVKQQRKKILKRIQFEDGRALITHLFHVAVSKLPTKE
jgi:DNA-binding NarL/FixJ family response regulator